MMADGVDSQDQARMSVSNSSCAGEPCGNEMEIEEEIVAALQRSDSRVFSRSNSMSSGSEAEEPLYIAVGKEYKESKPTVIWALRKKRRYKKIVLVHIHCPANMIHIMDGWYQVSDLTPEQVEVYRMKEVEKMNRTMEDYMYICEVAKVQAEKVVIEADEVAKGLIQVIGRHGVTKLVMGAAADKYFSKKMRYPMSKTARWVLKEAPPTCEIWFVCKGTLVCTSTEAALDWSGASQSPVSSPRARVHRTDMVRSKLVPQTSLLGQSEQDPSLLQELGDGSPRGGDICAPLPKDTTDRTSARSSLSRELPADGSPEAEPRYSQSSDTLYLGDDDEGTKMEFASASKGCDGDPDCSAMVLHVAKESEENTKFLYTEKQMDNLDVYDDWNVYLQQVVTEAAKLINGAYRESRLRYKAEIEALEANNRAKALQMKYNMETQQQEEAEESLVRARSKVEELEKFVDEVQGELSRACELNSTLQNRATESDEQVTKLKEKLSATEQRLTSLKNEKNELKREHDKVVKEVEEMRRTGVITRNSSGQSANFLEVAPFEIKQATCNLEPMLKIGEGASGCVYKGFLHQTSVIVKLLRPQSSCGKAEFQKEVGNLCKLRHPNLASLIGACCEERALVYEFVPNGSLEDHLLRKREDTPLSWRARISISAGICSALIFLHSSKPQPIVHGDLRPANILLDANFTSKVTDFGLVRLIDHSTSTLYNWNDPKGAFAYMDPEFFSTGELTSRSDTYSFGIIILRLLTGRQALGIVKEVQEALEGNRLQTILDPTAGDWPFLLAQQLSLLGLKCCEMKRRSRPDLAKDVWKILESYKVLLLP